MASKVQIKRSSVPSKVPTTADLDLGELAINTYDGKVFLKKSVAGTESIVDLTSAGPSGQYIISSQQIFTANANQTTFSVNYTVGYVDVHLNGIKLVSGQDFTATNGSSVVLTTAATAGDIVDITAGNTFSAGAGSANGIMPVELGGTASSTAAGARTNLGLGNVENKSSATIRSELTSTNVTTALGFTPYNSANPSGYISGNQTITFSGDATGSGTTSVALTLANSGVIAGTYGNANSIPQLTVDAKGRVTAVTNVGVNIPSGSLTFTGDVTGTGSTGSSTALTLANSGVTAGTYTKVTVDAKGRVTTGTTLSSADLPTYTGTITSSQVTTALGFTPYNATNPSGYISGNQTITFSGDATGSGATSVALTLANSGVTAGTYTKVTVDAKGRVTTGATLSASDIPNLDASKITSGVIDAARLPSYVDDVLEFANLAGFPATGETGKIYVALDTNKAYRWSGTVYVYITSGAVDSVAGKTGVVTLVKGDVGLGSVDNTADVSKNVLSATKWTTARTETLSGDVSGSASVDGSANWTITTTLANSGVTAGTYTKVTVDAKGRVTTGTTLASADLPTYTGTITSSQVTTALGFTPYNSTNPSGYITSSALSSYLPLSGGTLTGVLTLGSNVVINFSGQSDSFGYNSVSGLGTYIKGTGSTYIYGGGSFYDGSAHRALLHAGNYTSYSPTLTGNGASGTWGINVTGNAATVTTVTPSQLSPAVDYTTPTDASGYTWIRFTFAGGDTFNGGQQQIEFYVTRSINFNGNNPYGGCTAKFTAQAREWHGGQEMMLVQYGEHGSNSSAGAGFYISHARMADFAGGGYWVYLRVRSGITYRFREALHGGIGCDFSTLQGTTDPGSGQQIFSGLNLISTGGDVNFYDNGNPILHAGNYTSYALPLSGGTVTGATTFSSANDAQIFLNGAGTSWAGIAWTDVSGTDYTWFNGSTSTFAIGGSGSAVSGKKLHVNGGMTVGSGYSGTSTPSNGLNVQGEIQSPNIAIGGQGRSSLNAIGGNIGSTAPSWTNSQLEIKNTDAGTVAIAFHRAGYTSNTLDVRDGSGIRIDGSIALHVANYASYALPLSGGTMTGRLTTTAWTTSARNYSNEWIEFPNHSGLYSPLNGAHFYPNNANYGAWRIAGSRNNWAGLEFDASNGSVSLMINPDSNTSGFHNNTYGWQWRWNNGTIFCHKNAYGGGTGAVVLDTVNASSYAVTSVNGQVGAVTVAAGDGGALFSAFE